VPMRAMRKSLREGVGTGYAAQRVAQTTTTAYIPPMPTRRRIVFLAYDGFELLDLSGPAAVFSSADMLAGRARYAIVVAAPGGGPVRASCGVEVQASACESLRFGATDTVLALGAHETPLRAAIADPRVAGALRRAATRAERYGSICTGAFLLAAAGLLEGRRAATHWRGTAALRGFAAATTVEADALYVRDGRLWTSAGVSTGIDMALAMLERDLGARTMGEVAKELVLYAHRPGHQSQFSRLVDVQSAADGAFADVVAWMAKQLDRPLRVADMAARAGMSERTFQRRFAQAASMAPAKYFEHLRLDAAKRHLEAGRPSKAVAAQVGFRSESAFRAAFAAAFGVTPAHHGRMHRTDRGRVPR